MTRDAITVRPILEGHGCVIDGFLDRDACAAWVARAEALGFDEAPISTAEGEVRVEGVRNNDRAMVDDPGAAEALWGRLEPMLPRALRAIPMGGRWWRAAGLNERLRFYRYRPGQRFRWHADGAFHRNAEERSFFTVMIYLSAVARGGETRFHGGASVRPEPGRALLFWHPLTHEGAAVEAGRKVVLRTDLLFRAAEPLRPAT